MTVLALVCCALTLLSAVLSSHGPIGTGQPELHQLSDNYPFRWNPLIYLNPAQKSEKDYPKILTQKTMDLLSQAVNMLTNTKDTENKQWLETFVFKIGQLAVELEENNKKKQLLIEQSDDEAQPTTKTETNKSPRKHNATTLYLKRELAGNDATSNHATMVPETMEDDLVRQLHDEGHKHKQNPQIRVIVHHHPTMNIKKTTSKKTNNMINELPEAEDKVFVQNHNENSNELKDLSQVRQLAFQKQSSEDEMNSSQLDQANQQNIELINNDLSSYMSNNGPLKTKQINALTDKAQIHDLLSQKQSVQSSPKHGQSPFKQPQKSYNLPFMSYPQKKPLENSSGLEVKLYTQEFPKMKHAAYDSYAPQSANKLYRHYLHHAQNELPNRHPHEYERYGSSKQNILMNHHSLKIPQNINDNTQNEAPDTANDTHGLFTNEKESPYEVPKSQQMPDDSAMNFHYQNHNYHSQNSYPLNMFQQLKVRKNTIVEKLPLQNVNNYSGIQSYFKAPNTFHEDIERQLRAGKVIMFSDSVVHANFEKPLEKTENSINNATEKSTSNEGHV